MEFHGVKLLPKGLPEIIAHLVPYDIYPDTKVIALPRKGMKFNGRGGSGELGSVGFDHLTASYCIVLYPTLCCSNGGHGNDYPGTPSFRLWMGMLHVSLHEIGHMATYDLYYNLPHDYEHHYENHRCVEELADDWMNDAMARILQVDPRLGQPPGALTGYPGILAYEMRSNGGKPWDGFNPRRIADWRGLRCGGQVTINDIAEKLTLQEHPGYEVPPGYEGWAKAKARYRRAVHKAAKELGIERCFVNKNSRRYLMFNVGEAEAVYEWLIANKGELVDAYRVLKLQQESPKHWAWQLIDGDWGLLGIDTPEKVPPEQMRLPL